MNYIINLAEIYGASSSDYDWYQIELASVVMGRNLPLITGEYSVDDETIDIGVINHTEMNKVYPAQIVLSYLGYSIPVLNSGDLYFTPDLKYATGKSDGYIYIGVIRS